MLSHAEAGRKGFWVEFGSMSQKKIERKSSLFRVQSAKITIFTPKLAATIDSCSQKPCFTPELADCEF